MKIKSTCHAALDARNNDKLTARENILVQPKTLSNFIVMVMTYYVRNNDLKNNYVISNENNTYNTLEYKLGVVIKTKMNKIMME